MPFALPLVSRLLAVVVAAATAALPGPAASLGLLRDAGMEHGLERIAAPVITAAGLPSSGIDILVVDDLSMNAFVIDNRRVFLHAGLIMRLPSVEALQAVIAHEVAHIAHGHPVRRQLNAQGARGTMGLGLALALAAGALTANPAVAGGILAGSAGAAQRNFLAHTRAEEASADQSALRTLARAGIPPEAMVDLLALFAEQEAMSAGRVDPYLQTHPLTEERLRAADAYAERLAQEALPPPSQDDAAAYWFGRAKAKLSAYLRPPAQTFGRLRLDDRGDAAEIARAMAHYRAADLDAARAVTDRLRARRPGDAYLHELAGWIELQSGNAERALPAYRRAVDLAPGEPLIVAGYGRALLAAGGRDDEALAALEDAHAADPYDARMLRDLAVAYARNGEPGMASLATAERYALTGAPDDAALHARRAIGQLPTGAPGWSRAQDILNAAAADDKRR